MTWLPQVDGDLLTDLPISLIAAGAAKDKVLLASVCRDEWNLFQYSMAFNGNAPIDKLRDLDVSVVRHRFDRALLPADAEKAFALYSAHPFLPERGPLDWYAALETDRLFIAPTQQLLDAQLAAGGQAHACLFTHETSMFGVPMGACHVSDIPFVFDITDKPVGQLFTGGGEDARALAAEVQNVWGDVAHGRCLSWPGWQTRKARVFGPGETRQPLLSSDREAFWHAVFQPAESQAEPSEASG
jgi:para-nitrobenzyl esterase